jgi:hypothetical protein
MSPVSSVVSAAGDGCFAVYNRKTAGEAHDIPFAACLDHATHTEPAEAENLFHPAEYRLHDGLSSTALALASGNRRSSGAPGNCPGASTR